jgi:hypothetical protein
MVGMAYASVNGLQLYCERPAELLVLITPFLA